jgi:hypothetical protein
VLHMEGVSHLLVCGSFLISGMADLHMEGAKRPLDPLCEGDEFLACFVCGGVLEKRAVVV